MRGKGEGSVYRRADGYWVGSIEAGRYPNGKRRRLRVVRRYKADVLSGMGEVKKQVEDGLVPDRTTTVARYLDFWLTDVVAGQVSEGTLREYRKRVDRVVPEIGHVKLGKLTAAHVQALANHLNERYPRSAGTQRGTLGTLRRSLRWAVGAGMVPRNAADHVEGPRTEAVKVDDALTAEEAKAVLEVARNDDLYGLVWLALKYGLRMGELLSLRWDDIDFAKEEMSVRRSKTAAGVRTLPLTAEAKRVLQAHRKGQKVRSLEGFVFSRSDGRPHIQPYVGAEWSRLLGKAKVTHICRNCGSDAKCSSSVRRFHASRHTAATLLLEAGVPLEVVSAILGHANIRMTADIYAKVRNDLKRKGLVKIG